MFKSYLLSAVMIFAGLSSNAYSIVAVEDSDSVSSAYARLIQAEHQLLVSELAVEAKKSASFERLLADGHASWLENRQQKLVVDILQAELAAYEQFETQAMDTLTDREILFESNIRSMKTGSIKTRLATIQELQQELTTLRQAEAKLGNGVMTLPAGDPWAEGYRLRHVVAGRQANVVAAKIALLEQLNDSEDGINETDEVPEIVATIEQGSAFTAAWKRPSNDSSSMKLMITQAELQIQLSQHHLLNETQRLTALQELSTQGGATARSIIESQEKVDEVRKLLKEQQDNLSWLKKDLDDSPDTDRFYTSIEARPVSGGNAIPNNSLEARPNLPVLQSVLNQFELGQANYLRREAILKGEMYREILGRLEQSVGFQQSQTKSHRTSTDFSNFLITGQQRELEQYRWKIKKTELQSDLADAEIALLKDSGGTQSKSVNMLVSTGISSSTPVTLPSRFLSSDPFGLQTTYSAFAFSSPVFRARRPSYSATRADLSSVFRPIINRNALSYYRGFSSSRIGSSHGGFNRGNSFSPFTARHRPLPGNSKFGASPFNNNSHFNTLGRSSHFYNRSSGFGRYGY